MSRARASEEIVDNIREIAEGEKALPAVTFGTHIDLSAHLNPEEKYLLVLSKVITGSNTCTAIYRHSDGSFLVANNDKEPRNFEAVRGILGRYAEGRDISAARAAFSEIDKTIYFPRSEETSVTRAGPSRAAYGKASAVPPSTSLPEKFNQDVDFLLRDFELIGRRFVGNARFVSSDTVHAEMQLLPMVMSDRSTNEPAIMTSKLMCYPCHTTIEALSEVTGRPIKTAGTHGKTYLGWRRIPIVSDNSSLQGAFETRFLEKTSSKVAEVRSIRAKGGEAGKAVAAPVVDAEGFEAVARATRKERVVISTSAVMERGAEKKLKDESKLLWSNDDRLRSGIVGSIPHQGLPPRGHGSTGDIGRPIIGAVQGGAVFIPPPEELSGRPPRPTVPLMTEAHHVSVSGLRPGYTPPPRAAGPRGAPRPTSRGGHGGGGRGGHA